MPEDLRAAITSAKERKAPHLISRAEIAATGWLNAHPPSADASRVTGEHEPPLHPPP